MRERPVGTVTFLFTDLEGSTRAWEAHRGEMADVLRRHDEILSREVEAHGGLIILERGEGDSVFAVFARASDAVTAACALQSALQHESWPQDLPVRVRMAVHTGEAGADYRGPHVNRAARLRALAHGEQVLISGVTAGIVSGALPPRASLIDLGRHRLRDVAEMEHVFQLAHPELRADFPPLKSLGQFRQNLPLQLTSFVGRQRERETVRALLEQYRLVTLTGAGGSGKTRLAIQVAMDVMEEFPDGVVFVDLAPVTDAALVVNAVAESIGAKARQGASMLDVVLEALHGTRMLLICDNCEHLAAAPGDVIRVILRADGGGRVLATSRGSLGVAGEMKWRVPSLALPEETDAFEELARYEAVRLFLDRAAAARPGFGLTSANAGWVAKICRTLEGVPLAIELAAARARALSPREIFERLRDRFQLLTGGRGRHETLRSAIAWSYDLLPEEERTLFRRLSVFAGSFDLAAAEAIWGAGEPLDALEQLVEKSLVSVEAFADESTRYRLLETLRQYGAERLREAGEEEETRERHFRHYLGLAERAYADRIEDEAASLAKLGADHDDVRAALSWARKQPQDFLRLASAVGWFWHLRSFYSEGRRWLGDALAIAPSESSRERARALWALNMIAAWQGDAAGARQHAEESLQLWQKVGDRLELALALEGLGWSEFLKHDYQASLRLMEQCLEQYRAIGSPKLITRGRVAVGQQLVALGDVERTEPLARETLAEGRALGEPKFVHYALHFLADCALWRGEAAGAVQLYAESLRAALDYGNEMEAATEMQGVAMGLAGSGREREGLELFAAASAQLARLQTTLMDEIAFWVGFQQRYITPARERLDAGAVAAAESAGRAMSWQSAVERAFQLASPS